MKKRLKDNLFFIIFIILMLIPKTRMLLQTQVQKVIGYFNQPRIEEITNANIMYRGGVHGINTADISFSRLRGKVVIINYWATWCPPCVAEMPSFQELYEAYKNNDEVVFLFLTDDNIQKVSDFLRKHQYSLPVYSDNGTAFSNLNPQSIPTTYIANRKGEIKVKKTGSVQWNSKKVYNIITELLAD